MDMISENNYVRLVGVMAGRPEYSHSSRGQDFYTFPLEVLRLSGNCDIINIIVRPEMLESLEIAERGKLCVCGQLRTFNNRRGEGACPPEYICAVHRSVFSIKAVGFFNAFILNCFFGL